MPSLFFKEAGDGPPLVFLHGFCETHEIWDDFLRPLSEDFRVLLPDLPGFGKSEILPTPFTIDDVGDAVAKWLTEIKVSKAVVVGHSMGGYIALSMAAMHANLLRGFCLFHSTAFADTEEKKENRNRIIQFVSKNGVPPYIDTFVPGLFFDKSNPSIRAVHAIASQTKAATLIAYAQAMRERPDRSGELQKSDVPKILIVGVEDTVVPIQSSREMAKMAQNFSYLELENVGHMGIFEAKNECQAATKRFAYKIFFNNWI